MSRIARWQIRNRRSVNEGAGSGRIGDEARGGTFRRRNVVSDDEGVAVFENRGRLEKELWTGFRPRSFKDVGGRDEHFYGRIGECRRKERSMGSPEFLGIELQFSEIGGSG